MSFAALLLHRSLLRISGPDARAFLQPLLSNDVTRATSERAVHAALLTPQGKFLHDLFVFTQGDAVMLDGETARLQDLQDRLAAYKLRSKVAFENMGGLYAVWALWGDGSNATAALPDPRLPELGYRLVTARTQTPLNARIVPFDVYDLHRLSLGVADGSRDMDISQSTLAEGNFDFLNGIDWKKGCYVGQELTARLHHRGLAKKRLFPVRFEGLLPPRAPLSFDGETIGEMRSHCHGWGLALLNVETALRIGPERLPLTHGHTALYLSIPGWLLPARK